MYDERKLPLGKIIGFSVLGLIALFFIFGSFGTVSAGERGVKTRFSRVTGEIQPGLYFKMPFVEAVHGMDIQTQKVQIDETAASADLQDVKTTIALNFNLQPGNVTQIFTNVGEDYQDVIIDPAINESVKAVTARYTAEQLITQREKVRADMLELLTTKLESQGIQVSQMAIVNFSFSDDFNKAIESKVTAEQNALAAKNVLEQKTFEAQQTVVTAKAQAEAIQIQTAAINSQGGANYVQLEAIKKWNGVLPAQMIPGATVPFINLTK